MVERIFTPRGLYTFFTTGLWLAGWIIVSSAASVGAIADIGVSLEQTKSRSEMHAANHGGRHPLFETNKRGIVVRECWEAPRGGWTKPEAMSLVRDLIPQTLKKQTPRKMEREPGGEMLVFPDGTSVWLEHSSVRPTFRLVAVWASESRGHKC